MLLIFQMCLSTLQGMPQMTGGGGGIEKTKKGERLCSFVVVFFACPRWGAGVGLEKTIKGERLCSFCNYTLIIQLLLLSRVVAKISNCWVNTTSRWEIKQLGISFGSIFLLFSYASNLGPRS